MERYQELIRHREKKEVLGIGIAWIGDKDGKAREETPEVNSAKPMTNIPAPVKKPDLPLVSLPPLKPKPAVEVANPLSVSKKTAKGKVGGLDLTLTFNDKNKVEVLKSDGDGKVLGTGEWSQTESAVTILTENFRWMGTVNEKGIEGKQVSRNAGDMNEQQWSVAFIVQEFGDAIAPTSKAPQELTGTSWHSVYSSGSLNVIFTLEKGGKVTLTSFRGPVNRWEAYTLREAGKWHSSNEGDEQKVSIDSEFKNFGTVVGVIQGDRLIYQVEDQGVKYDVVLHRLNGPIPRPYTGTPYQKSQD